MTEPQQSPAAGWYPDPETPGRLRFWDGAAWAAQSQAATTFGRQVVPLDRKFVRLSLVVGAALTLVVLVSLTECVVDIWGISMFRDAVAAGDLAKAQRFDDLDRACAIGTLASVLLAGIAWCFWQHRLAASTLPGALRREPGMQVGSWFIPIVNLWFPVQNIRDMWHYVGRSRPATLVGWWWATFLISGFLTRISGSVSETADTVDEFNSATGIDLVATVFFILSALLAGAVVRTLTLGSLAKLAEVSQAGSPTV